MLEQTLNAREKTHGKFKEVAMISQCMKDLMGRTGYSYAQNEAIDMIVHKLARIASGNPNEIDHWLDIQGYCQLVIDDLNSLQ